MSKRFRTNNVFPGNPPILFIHIEKTAGSSIHKALYKAREPNVIIPERWDGSTIINFHKTADFYLQNMGREKFNNHFKFAFVRNPWTKIVSHWKYIKKFHRFDRPINTFEQFILEEHNWTPTVFKAQTDYILDNSGNLLVDFIGRFENLENDFNKIANKCNLKHDGLSKENASSETDYYQYYNSKTYAMVENKCKRDINYFGYKYEG